MLTETSMPRHCVFLFAHPDDEFACFESIRRVIAEGNHAICLYLTDGAYGGQPFEPRMKETRAVLSTFNVLEEDIHFIGVDNCISDGKLLESIDLAYACLYRCLAEYPWLDDVYVPAWEGGHQDHDAVHLIGLCFGWAAKIHGQVRQFSLYHGEGLRGPFFHVLRPLAKNGAVTTQALGLRLRLRYVRLCLGFPSQWKSWLGLFPPVALRLICAGCYTLQPTSIGRVAERPHLGKLLYERRGAFSWEEFKVLSTPFVRHHCRVNLESSHGK